MKRLNSLYSSTTLEILFIGLIATLFMDLWAYFVAIMANLPVEWRMIGRIVGYAFQGELVLAQWASAQPLIYENLYGWMTHYAVGLLYAASYILVLLKHFHKKHTLTASLVFSWLLMVFPLLLIAPLAGNGFFNLDAANPLFSNFYTLSCHTIFGIGLWVSAKWFIAKQEACSGLNRSN